MKAERNRALINNALKKYLNRLRGPAVLLRAMKYVVLSGGKRLRPLLTMESSSALGGNAGKTIPFACAIELIHNFSLVHDDLPAMDNDDTRRGKPACHKKFGEDIAILTGDALLNLAFGILSKAGHKKGSEIISLVSDAVGAENMIGGQVLDLRCTYLRNLRGCGNPQPTRLRRYRKINAMKTASLMAVSCQIGAFAANAKRKDAEKMYEFGKNLGLAFQIADDIEDAPQGKGALKKMRKEAVSFILEGKRNIAPFGKKADGLRYLLDTVLKKATKSR